MEQKKEDTAVTASLKEEINKEFAKITLQQIRLLKQQLNVKNIESINPLILKEVRENVTLVNSLNLFKFTA